MGARKTARKAGDQAKQAATFGFEANLWLAADKLRNNMDTAECKHVVLGLIFMTFDELRLQLGQALKDGTLIAPKHNPNNLTTTYPGYRTVLAHDLAQNLEGLIESGQYTVTEYDNKKFASSPLYLEIKPTACSPFSVLASGVAPRLTAVSSVNLGWHLLGESSTTIQQEPSSGELHFKGTL